jgi:type IV pilus assembly protein PilP
LKPPKLTLAKKYNSISIALVFCALIATIAIGCSNSGQSAKSTPIAQKTAPKPVSQVTPTVEPEKPETVYVYNTAGRRDPFAPIVVTEDKRAKSGERPPLERYNITEFKLSAIIWGGFGYNAMLEGPDGKGYFVRIGTVIGPNKGVVRKIAQGKLVIEEKYKKFSGETVRKEFVLELRKKQEGMQ